MKFMTKLLLIVMELAVICSGMEWDSVKDLDFWGKQTAEESRWLQELINPPTSSSYHGYAASHTPVTNEATSGP